MTDDLVFTLPDRDEMINDLVAFSGIGYKVRNLYPRFLEHAGTETTPLGLVMMVQLAVADYLAHTNGGPAMDAVMLTEVPVYVRLFTPEGPAREAALDVLRDAGLPDGRR